MCIIIGESIEYRSIKITMQAVKEEQSVESVRLAQNLNVDKPYLGDPTPPSPASRVGEGEDQAGTREQEAKRQ